MRESNPQSRLRVPMSGLGAGIRELDDETAHYVLRVHRLRPGDRFVAFDPVAATEADGELVDPGRGRGRCALSDPRPASNRSSVPVTLLQAMGKGDKLESVIAAATALGATRIVAVRTERAVGSDVVPSEARLRRWSKAAVEAARQSGRGDLPVISGPVALDAALQRIDTPSVRLCLHPAAPRTLSEALAGWDGATGISVLIGPEGGFSAAEVTRAEQAGFVPVVLGRFVLRTELAAVAALGAVVARVDSLGR